MNAFCLLQVLRAVVIEALPQQVAPGENTYFEGNERFISSQVPLVVAHPPPSPKGIGNSFFVILKVWLGCGVLES